MHRRSWIAVFLGLAVAVCLADFAHAQRRGRLFRSRGNNYNQTYAYQGAHWPAVKFEPESAPYQPLSIAYSYDQAISAKAAFSDKLRVFIRIADPEVLADKDIVAEVKIADLSDYQTMHVCHVPLHLHGQRAHDQGVTFASLDVAKLDDGKQLVEPGHVYRLFINLHRKSASYDEASAIGRIPSPYYAASSGATALLRARRQIVMRTFKEWYYTQWGWWSGEQYVMDCYAFYMWATGFCTVGADYGHTRMDRLFAGGIPYHVGAHVPELSSTAAIHGDYVRVPGHSFMILAYDAQQHHVVTMEGNYNSSLEIAVRPLDGSWTVGHLVAEHIREGLFEEGPDHDDVLLTDNSLSPMM